MATLLTARFLMQRYSAYRTLWR